LARFAYSALLAAVLGAVITAASVPARAQTPAAAAPGGAAPGAAGPAAIDAYGQLEDPALQARFEHITAQLRCLVCQNESIADSNVELASDLRRQVREMLLVGQGDAVIFKFMTDRYGEFVRFNPPLEAKTLFIWGAPFVMLLLGVLIVYRIVRQRSRMPLDDEPAPGSM
jgi:cytochrome c-type biogenesis protein CcmH